MIVLGGLPLLYFLRFDFNPMNLRSPKAESIATYLDLRSDPATGASAIDMLAPSLAAAAEMADRVSRVPEVSRVMTLESFIPDGQEPSSRPSKRPPRRSSRRSARPPSGALRRGQRDRAPAASRRPDAGGERKYRTGRRRGQAPGRGHDAAGERRSGGAREGRIDLRAPLKTALDGTAELAAGGADHRTNYPADFAGDWIKPDGRARVQVDPKGDPNDNEVLRQFARAVLAVEPTATGGPIAILEAGHTVTSAFMQAGFTALISITIMLWITLRRFSDVLLTLIPLLLAGVVTLEICVVIGLPLNFANIIALPLLLGVGVAFKIYYIMAWRAGQTDLLQSSLTRAVIFSAMTTATAFGSLWLSSHPGTSSMGKLLALTLACTLVAAVLFQPLLMGRPREIEHG